MKETTKFKARPNNAQSLAEKAYARLKAMILSNELQAGQYMLEDDVNELVGMSRTPLRSALARLEYDGMISIIPRRGIRIMTLTLDDLYEIYSLLEAIEALVIKSLATAIDHVENGSKLIKLVDEMDAALENNDLEKWAAIYSAFHSTLVGLGGMKRAEKLASNLLDQSHRIRIFTLRMRDKPLNVNSNQRALAKAILAGDISTALEVNELHSRKRLAEITEIFRKFKLTQM